MYMVFPHAWWQFLRHLQAVLVKIGDDKGYFFQPHVQLEGRQRQFVLRRKWKETPHPPLMRCWSVETLDGEIG